MRIGTYKPEWGGIKQEDIVEAINSGKILIPQIEVLPTDVIANPDNPPELEIRFDMVPNHVVDIADCSKPLPVNWALRFIHNQLFKHFEFPSRFCPGAFHSTIVRKAEFRSDDLRRNYFEQCRVAIEKWHEAGPQPLNNGWDVDGSALENPPEHTSGLWLFTDRENITHSFLPNFLPPYDTPEKRQVIADFLKEEWDEKALCWKDIGFREREVAAEAIRKAEARTRAEKLRRDMGVSEVAATDADTKEEEKKPEGEDFIEQYALVPLAALKDRTPSTKVVIKTFQEFIGDVKGAHNEATEELSLLFRELDL
uniref:Uncharacterized protein n=1 Tax=Grammatophora oceanica TaxID=210454 RepID=A0A7S1V3N1_9STRA|mmetsp:Transcript_35754/g.53311  ORF Transcript_35754/g.53311 Transcript_35754/m.53311 type:complete len:311 (+) Transcript_35754:340-1272(+)